MHKIIDAARTRLVSFCAITILIIVLYITFSILRRIFVEFVCWNERVVEIPRYHDLDFLIVERYCDFVAHTAELSVSVSVAGNLNRTPIFVFDPITYQPMPQIRISPAGNIHISVPAISSILRQYHEWNGRKITYDIGEIDYRSTKGDKSTETHQ